ncbi:MAG: hypothetical protein ACREMQ_04330 [Longimicrobiales bacterium]
MHSTREGAPTNGRHGPTHTRSCPQPTARRGEQARGGGWLARAQRLIDDLQRDCVDRGYLLFPVALRTIVAGEFAAAYDLFTQAAGIAERFHDPTWPRWRGMARGVH